MAAARSVKVNSAENTLKKSIGHYLLLFFNYPTEAVDCIQQLQQALELLLRESASLDGMQLVESKTFEELINSYQYWDQTQKDLAHWIRIKRNKVQHKGEPPWEEKTKVREKLSRAYRLIAQIYISFGFNLEANFTPLEQTILCGKELGWKNESHYLVNAAYLFYEDDPEMAIQISNSAVEKAIRGLAESWRIPGARTMAPRDVINAMYDNEYQFTADIPINYESYQTEPYYFAHEEQDNYRRLSSDRLENNYKVLSEVNKTPQKKLDSIKKVLDDNRDIVLSFILNAPYLDYFESVVLNWSKIVNEFQRKFPDVIFPALMEGWGIRAWWDEEKAVSIHFQEGSGDEIWDEPYKSVLLDIIKNICGSRPEDLELELLRGLGI